MGIKQYNPVTAGRRGASVSDFAELTPGVRPEKALLRRVKKKGGRNNQGRITARHRGGGHKQQYRLIDFRRDKDGVPAKVHSIEYDPNRNARIALLHFVDGEKRYIIAPVNIKVGTHIMSGPQAELSVGNTLPLRNIPTGTTIHNIELRPGQGARLVRSAGNSAQLMAKDGDWAQVRLPSGEVHRIHCLCMATIGQVGNPEHAGEKLGKAGRSRHKGIRPTVRGSAMSPRDHPHGGGEGRQPIGLAGPKSPWGKPTLGYKTRRNKKTDQYIVRRRSKTNR